MVSQQKGWRTPWNTVTNCRLLHIVAMARKHYLSKDRHGDVFPCILYGEWGAIWWEIEAEQSSKDDSATATWKQVLVVKGMERRGWTGTGRGTVSDSLNPPAQPVDFVGSFRKKIDAQNNVKKILSVLYGQLWSEILRITHITYGKYNGAGWHREKPGTAQRTVTGNKELVLKVQLKPKQDRKSTQKQQDSRSQRGLGFIP